MPYQKGWYFWKVDHTPPPPPPHFYFQNLYFCEVNSYIVLFLGVIQIHLHMVAERLTQRSTKGGR